MHQRQRQHAAKRAMQVGIILLVYEAVSGLYFYISDNNADWTLSYNVESPVNGLVIALGIVLVMLGYALRRTKQSGK